MRDRLRALAALATLAGVLVAGYLTMVHYRESSPVCPVGGSCETVLESDYAELVGVPVSLLGLLAYAVLLALLAWDAPLARLAAAALAFTGLVFSLFLLGVQAFALETFCAWCLVNDVVIAPAVALLTALRLRS